MSADLFLSSDGEIDTEFLGIALVVLIDGMVERDGDVGEQNAAPLHAALDLIGRYRALQAELERLRAEVERLTSKEV